MENRFEQALKFVDDAVFATTGRHLKDLEVVVFRGSWQRLKYYEIAKANRYSHKYIQQDISPKLWKLLSKVLDEPVKKTNFRETVERKLRERN